MQAASQGRVVGRTTEEDGFVMSHVALREDESYLLKPTCVWLTERMDGIFCNEPTAGITKMSHLLDAKVVSLHSSKFFLMRFSD